MRAQAWHLMVLLGLACSGGSGHGLLGNQPDASVLPVSVASEHPIASSADNVVPVYVDYGLPDIGYINGLFATVTLCVPGTNQCQNIEHVIVDTGSSGLRVMGSALTIKLPALTNDQGVTLAECGQFVGGYTWGPMASADFKMGAKQVNGLPVHVIEKTTFPVPSDCTGEDVGDVEKMGANGILGIATSIQDCGVACTPNPPAGYRNPKVYYACTSSKTGGCVATTVSLEKQLTNPVPLFSEDNNGTIIQLPSIPDMGSESVVGALVFGIGTRDNNALGDAHIIHLNSSGLFQSHYSSKGILSNSSDADWVLSFIDSGSNALYFLDSKTADIPTCTDSRIASFYCPKSTKTLVAQAQSYSGEDGISIEFQVASTYTLMSQVANNVAFNDLAGPSTEPQSGSDTSGFSSYFDYGLPFYYGRNVYTAIEDRPTPAGSGPYVAF
jgi:hypothetical protein